MWHLWQRYKQKSPFQESTQAPQLCFWYTVRVIGRERHEQNFNELSVFGKLNLIMSSNLVKWPQDWQGQTRSHGSRSKLLVDIQPGHEVVSTQIRDAVGSQPFASEDSTPWKAPRTFDCIFKQSASIMKMTGHLDDGFYHALRYQQSRHFNTCQGSKLRTMSHLLRQAIVILLHPVMQQPASPQLHKKPGDGGCWVKSTCGGSTSGLVQNWLLCFGKSRDSSISHAKASREVEWNVLKVFKCENIQHPNKQLWI